MTKPDEYDSVEDAEYDPDDPYHKLFGSTSLSLESYKSLLRNDEEPPSNPTVVLPPAEADVAGNDASINNNDTDREREDSSNDNESDEWDINALPNRNDGSDDLEDTDSEKEDLEKDHDEGKSEKEDVGKNHDDEDPDKKEVVEKDHDDEDPDEKEVVEKEVVEKDHNDDFDIEEDNNTKFVETPIAVEMASCEADEASVSKTDETVAASVIAAKSLKTIETTKTIKKARKKKTEYSADSYFVHETEDDVFVVNDDIKKYLYVLPRQHKKGFENIVQEQNLASVKPTSRKKTNLQSPPQRASKKAATKAVVSKSQTEGFNEYIFTEKHFKEYCKILAKSGEKKETPMKTQFIVNLMIDYNLHQNVLKYDESALTFRKCHNDFIYHYLLENFSKKSREGRKVTAKQKTTTSKSPTKNVLTTYDAKHPLHSALKYGNKIYTEPSEQHSWFNRFLQLESSSDSELSGESGDYQKDDYMNEKSHSMFSVIHPLFEEYEIFLYNGSHRLAYSPDYSKPVCVHAKTKLKFKFPAPSLSNGWKSFFILFNSRLVHGGSRAYRQGILSSQHRVNFRLFTYIIQTFQGTKARLSEAVDEEDSLADNTTVKNTRAETIDQTSFKVCDPYKCKDCAELKVKETVIDVEMEYQAKMKAGNSTLYNTDSNKHAPSHVCGDLDVHGWEVHEGVDYMNDTKQFKYLKWHLETLFYGPQKHWSDLVKNRGRSFLKLTHIIESTNRQFLRSKDFVLDVFIKKQSEILRNIRGFRMHKTDGSSLLANRGICQEQIPHRDFVKAPEMERSTKDMSTEDQVNVPTRSFRDSTSYAPGVPSTSGRTSKRRIVQPQYYSPSSSGRVQNKRKKQKKSPNPEFDV